MIVRVEETKHSLGSSTMIYEELSLGAHSMVTPLQILSSRFEDARCRDDSFTPTGLAEIGRDNANKAKEKDRQGVPPRMDTVSGHLLYEPTATDATSSRQFSTSLLKQ
jgi:hypothetical protein